MALDPEIVQSLVSLCLLRPDEPRDGAIEVEGIRGDYSFHVDRIAENTKTIGELLFDLPDQFKASFGGGWSFLNACIDRHGNQWTGLHQRMEELVCLGIAAKKAKWQMRELVDALPGGVPFFVVL
nr:hypothetical protein [uncultured Rhodopila sp.]